MKSAFVTRFARRVQCAALVGVALVVAGVTPCASAGDLVVHYPTDRASDLPRTIQVVLYREGKVIRTGEVSYDPSNFNRQFMVVLLFQNLPAGPYELRFQAPGYQEVVKPVAVPEGRAFGDKVNPETGMPKELLDRSSLVLLAAELGEKITRPGGPGVGTTELIRELQELRREVSELRTRVERLEAQLGQLKRK